MPRALRSGQNPLSSVENTHYRWPTLSMEGLPLLIHFVLKNFIAVCRITWESTVRVTGTWRKGKTIWCRFLFRPSQMPHLVSETGVGCYSQQSLREPEFTQSGKEDGEKAATGDVNRQLDKT